MQSALRPYFTTGVAIVGASVIAVAPLSIPPANQGLNIASVVQSAAGDVNLTALTGTFDALINAGLAGAALSLGLEGSVNVDATAAANFANLVADVIAEFTGALGTDPFAALTGLLTVPITAATGFIGGLVDAIGGGFPGIPDTGTDPITAILDFLDGLTGGNLASLIALPLTLISLPFDLLSMLAGSFDGSVDGGLGGAISAGLSAMVDLFTAPIVVGGQLAVTGANLFVNGAAAFTAAIGDVLTGFLDAGETTLGGISDGIALGAQTLTTVLEDAVQLLSDAVGGGAALLAGAIDTGATALGDIVDGFANALAEFSAALSVSLGGGVDAGGGAGVGLAGLVPMSAAALTADPAPAGAVPGPVLKSLALAPSSTASDAAQVAGSAQDTGSAQVGGSSVTTVELPPKASDTAKAPAVTTTISGAADAGVTGKDLGAAVSGVASAGKSTVRGSGSVDTTTTTDGASADGSAQGSVDAGGSVSGSADTGGSVSGNANAGGSASGGSASGHANAHAEAHAKK